jgi:DNA-binding NarL/FixJ family response regulator
MPVRRQILLIDDDPIVHLTFKHAILQAKKDCPELILSIDHAMFAETAVKKIIEISPYNLCIVDYLLVRRHNSSEEIIDSEEACKKVVNALKAHSSETIVVLHTDYFETEEQIQKACKRLGISGHLSKVPLAQIWIKLSSLLFLEDI